MIRSLNFLILIFLISACATVPSPSKNIFNESPCYLKENPDTLRLSQSQGIVDLFKINVGLETSSKSFKKKSNVEVIQNAYLHIESVAAEIDCEEERADQASQMLGRIEKERQNKLIVRAIVIGAAGGILSGAIILSGAETIGEVIGISTGLVEGFIGYKILKIEETVKFKHERNFIRDILNQPQHAESFPPFIWRFLTDARFSTMAGKSRLEILIERWKKNVSSKDLELFKGDVGFYNQEQLKLRAGLLDQLEAEINLLIKYLHSASSDLMTQSSHRN